MSGGAPDDAGVKAEECGGGDADGRDALGQESMRKKWEERWISRV